LARITKQGWPLPLLKLVRSFLTNQKIRVRLEKTTTGYYNIKCGIPQESLLSLVLYMLYLAELIAQDPMLRFGYTDDICLYRATKCLNINISLLIANIRSILAYGTKYKIFFAPEKLEMIYLTKKAGDYILLYTINEDLIIYPITTIPKESE
jgi:hypothetical protein